MSISLITDGSTTTDGTEQTLATDTANHTYVLALDTANMVNGDRIEVKLWTKVRSGGTSRVAYSAVYAHAQANPNKESVPVPANIEIKATIKRVAGTDRAYPWALKALS